MTTLIAIPYWTTAAPYIDEAVASALAQTERDLVVMVAGDGVEPPLTVRDPRLVSVAFPTNEGAPATQQAMLQASPFRWYAPMGADDRIAPEYIASLLALGARANATHVLWHFNEHETWRVHDSDGNPAHTEFGVFDTELLRSLGGYGADRRVGQDTLLYLQLLPHVTPISWLEQPLYFKRIHEASLTHAPETTFGSPIRNEVFEHNAVVADTIARWGFGDLARVRQFREWLLGPAMREVMEQRVAMVRDALGRALPSGQAPQRGVSLSSPPRKLLAESTLPDAMVSP